MEKDSFYVEEKYNLPFTEENRNALSDVLRWKIICLKNQASKKLAIALRASARAKEMKTVVEVCKKEKNQDKVFLSKIKKKLSSAKTACFWNAISYEETLNEINEIVRVYNKLQVVWGETNKRLNPHMSFGGNKEFYVYPELGGLESKEIFKDPNY